jgi:hypothetical protein
MPVKKAQVLETRLQQDVEVVSIGIIRFQSVEKSI